MWPQRKTLFRNGVHTHSNVCVCHDSLRCVPRLPQIWDVTHSHLRNHSANSSFEIGFVLTPWMSRDVSETMALVTWAHVTSGCPGVCRCTYWIHPPPRQVTQHTNIAARVCVCVCVSVSGCVCAFGEGGLNYESKCSREVWLLEYVQMHWSPPPPSDTSRSGQIWRRVGVCGVGVVECGYHMKFCGQIFFLFQCVATCCSACTALVVCCNVFRSRAV